MMQSRKKRIPSTGTIYASSLIVTSIVLLFVTHSSSSQTSQCKSSYDRDITACEKSSFKWDLHGNHRCNIKRISISDLYSKFGKLGLPPLYHEPLIIYDKARRKQAKHANHDIDEVYNGKFMNMTAKDQIILSMPDNFNVTLSSSNSISEHRLSVPLTQYIEEIISNEVFPDQLSNESWYLFGETYSEAWKKLLMSFKLPPCQTCSRELSALAFGIGGRGSGVQWHMHGPGFSESIHGRKHW